MRPVTPTEAPYNSVFASRWAEVTYFLRPTGELAAGATPLYGLYRRQHLLAEKTGGTVNVSSTSAQLLADVSTWAGKVNGPKEITVPGRRSGLNPFVTTAGPTDPRLAGLYLPIGAGSIDPALKRYEDEWPGSALTAGDLILGDVICFEVKVLWDIPTDTTRFRVTGGTSSKPAILPPLESKNADYPFDYLPVGHNPYFNGTHASNTTKTVYRVFDTWSQEESIAEGYNFFGGNQDDPKWNQGYFLEIPAPALDTRAVEITTIPLRVRVKALQIKLRIWDAKSQQTRQVTIIQDV
jgi:hypothetical protein